MERFNFNFIWYIQVRTNRIPHLLKLFLFLFYLFVTCPCFCPQYFHFLRVLSVVFSHWPSQFPYLILPISPRCSILFLFLLRILLRFPLCLNLLFCYNSLALSALSPNTVPLYRFAVPFFFFPASTHSFWLITAFIFSILYYSSPFSYPPYSAMPASFQITLN